MRQRETGGEIPGVLRCRRELHLLRTSPRTWNQKMRNEIQDREKRTTGDGPMLRKKASATLSFLVLG